MKTGILGGTFNPIHNSHLYIAWEYRSRLGLDRILFIPTYTPPHKSAEKLASAEHRLAMCRLAVALEPDFFVCDYEASRPEKSYTYRTLEYLAGEYPEDELYFLMGADMFLTVQDWVNPERIYARATLCAAAREPGEVTALLAHRPTLEQAGAKCMLLEIQPKPLSSTEIRRLAAEGADIRGMVPDAVADYMTRHGLYRGKSHD